MSAGTIALIGLICASLLGGISFIFYEWWTTIRIPWIGLGRLFGVFGIRYYSAAPSVTQEKLETAVRYAMGSLTLNTKWSSDQIAGVFHDFYIYVHDDDVNAGTPGIFGYEQDGVIGVNRKLSTLCHELGHLLQERIDKIIDYDHAKFDADGINKADDSYRAWLATEVK